MKNLRKWLEFYSNYQVPIKPDVKYLISRLKERGDRIIIATTRPFEKYSLMRLNTTKWLESNNIYFESLVNNGELYKEGFDIHIDDELGDILVYPKHRFIRINV